MSKKIAILQSNYIPWKGYFDIIASVDEFIFYDEMQYTKNDWRNRNKIKTPNGLHWLSIPVATKGHLSQDVRIMDAKIVDKKWANSHWNTIKQFYRKTPYFNDYSDIFEKIYKECKQEEYLCKVNYKFIYAINEILRIKTKISFSQDYGLIDGKTERLVDLVKKASGTEYLSGPAAKDYIDEKLFKEANIKLSWMDYSNYPEYPQLYPPFEHGVSILDLIFNCGPEARKYMKR
ncbi:WbqC family protein [Campylobacter lanienae]|uniref:WbqC family protein n=1 Tax=Campylobacter lanienae TaxID=75658 RepID=A0ABY3G7I8_9BACT|nr:WbqC family protein [Campylobacter lanienae]TWO28308.1 WbqC family protein [Campylobacter lanienae]